jgi:hypothetical protein
MRPLSSLVFRMLLRAYPEDFRAAYGHEMMTVIADMQRDTRTSVPRLWSEMTLDMIRTAMTLRLESLARRDEGQLQHPEVMMIIMAILAIAVGAIEAANSMQEVWVRGALNSGWALAGGIIATGAGILLLIAGIGLLRRPKALTLPNVSAVACLAVFILVGVLKPQMSIFATILGIGFPLLMLSFVYWSTRRSLSGPSAV